jgi:hypothetical protein
LTRHFSVTFLAATALEIQLRSRMVLTRVVIILVLGYSIFECSAQLMSNNEPICAGQVFLPSNYSRLIGPYNASSSINIKVDLDVLQILEVNDQLFTVSLNMYFGVQWQDTRILSPPTDNPNILALSFMDHLWVPDVYIYNLKSTQTLNIISEFAGILIAFVKIWSNLLLCSKAVQQRYFSASSLQFATLTIGKKRTVQKETQSNIATACMQKSEHNICIVTCTIYKNDLTG